MAITRWDPFKDLMSLRDKMNKLFEDSISRSQTIDHDFPAGAWRPTVDIYETADKMILFCFHDRRRISPADIHYIRTAVFKSAPFWHFI